MKDANKGENGGDYQQKEKQSAQTESVTVTVATHKPLPLSDQSYIFIMLLCCHLTWTEIPKYKNK
ncbi:hypothetical protein GCM10011571_08010 [Marinithermofilum abyssi]|uniref:Uncharacterized protein n=1 Tax=Marinithermofilum abyssi TaxID=1571185 RepID=A0A8J2Y8U1_9BACL|nr:hypothetical protein GCM10011571_08010 [Marinithermofilum abyssi]